MGTSSESSLKSILIAQRGEIAVRIIRACREMGIRAVAVYSEADLGALHVRLADAAVNIGPPSAAESYLHADSIIVAAKETSCEAIHPGYGFLSENADFAAAVHASGLIWIGPSPEAIRAMGDKTRARRLMAAAGVPVVPDWEPDDPSISYPVLVKADAGGGGKGMRQVESAGDLAEAVSAAQREAQSAFGDDRVFIEKYIPRARHIEIQILADTHGNLFHLFERECSVQRRYQKIIEETPSPLLDAAMRERMTDAALAAARAVNYTNAGTVEFIVDTNTRDFYFLEMNTRLQVEHPVTEMVTGIDLVQEQIRIAAGEGLTFSQSEINSHGHAIECRIYAEDPASDFLPAAGPVLNFVTPQGPGIRLDTGVASGDRVTVYYDPLMAKLVVHAATREAALRKMGVALSEVNILGLTTNISFLQDVIADSEFQRGEYTTALIEERYGDWNPTREAPELEVFIAQALAELTATTKSSHVEAKLQTPWDRTDGFRPGA